MKEKEPFISFITPTYNRENLIQKAIISVINQKQNIAFKREMIIIDDGSTDKTKEIIGEYIKKYPKNIKYFYQRNSGIPGKARNIGLEHMNKESVYTIFIDSDDELKIDVVYSCLKKVEELKKKNLENQTIGFYFLCEDEDQNIIGEKKILQGNKERRFDYHAFLKGEINIEMGIWLKSNIFIQEPKLRFSEYVISESVMRAKMRQYMNQKKMNMLLWEYIGRFYRLNHNSETRVCKNITTKRFKNNAEGNKEVLKIIGKDLKKFGYNKIYADYLFKIGINYILCGEKNKGLNYIKRSYKKEFKFITFVIYILSIISRKIILFIYKLYI